MPRGTPVGKPGMAKAKADVVAYISDGLTVREAITKVQRSMSTYELWRREDADFRERIDKARERLRTGLASTTKVVPDFPEFCLEYLGLRLWPHQLQWYDLLEGREPRDLHSSQTYVAGRGPTRLVINTPPGHAKSTTITVAYVIWRICKNPDIKVAIVSKKAELARQFLLQIKETLTNPQYEKLQAAFAPPGGWDQDSAGWTANHIYLSSSIRSADQKDPTVQALGIRSALYGSRLDLVILDDAIDDLNAADHARQMAWIQSIVSSRLFPRTGRIIVVGTRIAAKDLYSELMNGEHYLTGVSPWRFMSQPAVLEFQEDPADWRTLWPYADVSGDPDEEPEESGLYRRFDGPTLSDIRDGMVPALWARVYQQEQVSDQGTFPPELVAAARGGYPPGSLTDDESLGRVGGVSGLRLVAGLDPAVTGCTAAVLVGLDVKNGHRWIIDVFNKANCTPDEIRSLIKGWTDRYAIQEWRIEKNSFQGFLTQDTEIRNYLAARGVVLSPHFTSGSNKHDTEFGVAAMASLFHQHLIHTPTHSTEPVRALVEQLIGWSPGVKNIKTDVVMALWFAELRCRDLVANRSGTQYIKSEFHTRADLASQYVVTREDMENWSGAGAHW